MLFHKKTKSILRVFWTIIAVLVGLSMIFLYAPIFQRTTPQPSPIQPVVPEAPAPTETVPENTPAPDTTFSPVAPQ